MKSCDNCTLKLTKKNDSKYKKHNVYCTKRKCVIPTQDEAKWCKFYDEIKKLDLKMIGSSKIFK